jgi:uncharacterized membrane protein
MTVQGNKNLGVLGASLTIAGAVGVAASVLRFVSGSSAISILELGLVGVGALLGFLGFIFFMVAMHGFSSDYSERKIFDYVLNGFVFAFVATIIAAVLGLFAAVSITLLFSPGGSSNSLAFATGVSTAVISAIQIVYILFLNKGLNLLADKSGSSQLHTATRILFAGAVTSGILSVAAALIGLTGLIDASAATLILIPGSVIQYIAWYYAARGFLAIQPPATPTQPYYAPYTTDPMQYCPNCGTPTQPDSVYCVHCGKKL